MSEQSTTETASKWNWKRKCACGECRFYSWEERPKCPSMEADPSLRGEKLWYMDIAFLGIKDYKDPLDFAPPQAFTEKVEEKLDEEKEE